MHYQLLRDGFLRWKDADIYCAVCHDPALHRLLVSPDLLVTTSSERFKVPPELRGLCRECGRGRHSFSYVSDDEIERLRDCRKLIGASGSR
jgi:hypothetical protein